MNNFNGKFIVGDVVQRIKGEHNGMVAGDKDEIVKLEGFHPTIYLKKYGSGHDFKNLAFCKLNWKERIENGN